MRSSDQINENVISKAHDKEIYDTKHDEIMMWLYEQVGVNKAITDQVFGLTPGEGILRLDKRIEHALCDNRGNPVGFCDLFLKSHISLNLTESQLQDNLREKQWHKDKEITKLEGQRIYQLKDGLRYSSKEYQVVMEQYEALPKFDTHYNGKTHELVGDRLAFIEVKTKINIGETIRQINYYKNKTGYYDIQWFVCCPDDRFESVLYEQKIGFIKYDPSSKQEPS